VRPDLGQVERVESVVLGIGLRHDRDRHRPAQELAAFDRLVRAAAVVVDVLTGDPVGISAGQALGAPGWRSVILPTLLAGLVDPHVRVSRTRQAGQMP
jgi:hypothetical protein